MRIGIGYWRSVGSADTLILDEDGVYDPALSTIGSCLDLIDPIHKAPLIQLSAEPAVSNRLAALIESPAWLSPVRPADRYIRRADW